MPTLFELTASPSAMSESADRVVVIALKSEAEDIDTNKGICTAQELIDRANKGDSISFDYKRLIAEASSYE